MRILNIQNLHSGMITGADVKIGDTVIVPKGVILTDSLVSLISSHSKDISTVWVYDLLELKPLIFSNNSLVRQYIDFLIDTFRKIFNITLVDSSCPTVLLKFVEKYFLANRELLYEALVLRDNHCYTYEHSMNVAMYGLLIGLSEELSDKELKTLIYGCLLHDIGKLNINNSILDKPTKLNEFEFTTIKQHPLYGMEMFEEIKLDNNDICNIITQHHEKLDGTGYPYGLQDGKITHLAKIAAVADIFDAVTSQRAYHRKRSIKDGIEILNGDLSRGKINGDEVRNLIKNLVIFPVNTMVVLNNGVTGFVLEDCRTMYPKIIDMNQNIYDLNVRRDLKIIEVL